MSHVHGLKIVKMSKAFYRFNATPVKIPIPLFSETEKCILKFI